MKYLLITISLMLSFNLLASHILNGQKVISNTNPVIVEKTSNTPFNNLIEFPVVTNVKECVESEQMWVFEQNAKECGYELEPVVVCTSPDNCLINYNEVARSCSFSKTVCKKYNTYLKESDRKFNLQFSNFLKEAVIKISIDRDETLEIDVEGINPACVKKVFYKRNDLYTGAKLKLKRRCR